MGRLDLGELRRLEPDSAIVQELKTLTRDPDAVIHMQTRLVNQLTACLKDYYPVALELFAKLQQRSTLIFLQTYPTPQQAMGASREQIAQTLKQAGHTNPEKAAQHIFETVHRPSLLAPAVTTRTKSRLALALVAQLLPLVQDIGQYDKEIERGRLCGISLVRSSRRQPLTTGCPGGDGPRRRAGRNPLTSLSLHHTASCFLASFWVL